jgi:hypothetical protein
MRTTCWIAANTKSQPWVLPLESPSLSLRLQCRLATKSDCGGYNFTLKQTRKIGRAECAIRPGTRRNSRTDPSPAN